MVTVVLAWLAVLAVCVAAVLFGQTARSAPRRRSATGRIGLFLSLSGPWLAVVGGVVAGALSGAWLLAAAGAAAGVVLTSVVGLSLAPH
ncbi:hypothetical protein [Blastococcus sp. CT_GayMR16]|uniref:hypothetical protein n=1 Tax=Blastococcus sp. CT_GayMR16 TaxID=2559607 RepID=UPI00107499CE|nr:hypothetical protein [Blastococcus sp. CT_GayMR16]TFV90547.1 hypothetical protein E4P38_03755 [Blastococcus sp. CT_GayMR16]